MKGSIDMAFEANQKARIGAMLTLEIITPDEQVLSTEAVQVILPTSSGETGILAGHVPMVTQVVAGRCRSFGMSKLTLSRWIMALPKFWAIPFPF